MHFNNVVIFLIDCICLELENMIKLSILHVLLLLHWTYVVMYRLSLAIQPSTESKDIANVRRVRARPTVNLRRETSQATGGD